VRLKRPTSPGGTSFLSTARSLAVCTGSQIRPGSVHGYYIDFTSKTDEPSWPPRWLAPVERQLHVETTQWALGCFERFLAGDGEAWLEAAAGAGRHLLDIQDADGGWRHHWPMHTYHLEPPWVSAMAQGEAASLLVRLHVARGGEDLAEGARRALEPMYRALDDGGVRSVLAGHPFLEEYPTRPPSHVLNGAIFALWGYYDVGVGLDDERARRGFEYCAAGIAAGIDRYDTGRWSRYDLYPHALANLASPAYHSLHIEQLRALELLAPHPEIAAARERFEAYRGSRLHRARAFAGKAAFRLAVPRNATVAKRMPWARRAGSGDERHKPRNPGLSRDRLVLCYHAIASGWDAPLAVEESAFEEHVSSLVDRGYRGVTFGEVMTASAEDKVVAITFDDAYRSVHRRALPILEKHGLVATVFAPSAFIGSERPMSWPGIDRWLGGPFEEELVPMSWDELSALALAGWEIGSHTRTHPHLTTLDDESLERQLRDSKTECEAALGRPCRTIAYPYGDHDDRVIAATRAAGYDAAGTLPSRLRGPGALEIPRIGIYHGDDLQRFRRKISPPGRWFRTSPFWELVELRRRVRRRARPASVS
jgi:peptidoglycan/xylan/chitin deacetylase (PgdA/CDA1 family)